MSKQKNMERKLNGISLKPYSTGLGHAKSDAMRLLAYFRKELFVVPSIDFYLVNGDNVSFGGCHDCKRNENEPWSEYVTRSNKSAIDYIKKVEIMNRYKDGVFLVYPKIRR